MKGLLKGFAIYMLIFGSFAVMLAIYANKFLEGPDDVVQGFIAHLSFGQLDDAYSRYLSADFKGRVKRERFKHTVRNSLLNNVKSFTYVDSKEIDRGYIIYGDIIMKDATAVSSEFRIQLEGRGCQNPRSQSTDECKFKILKFDLRPSEAVAP